MAWSAPRAGGVVGAGDAAGEARKTGSAGEVEELPCKTSETYGGVDGVAGGAGGAAGSAGAGAGVAVEPLEAGIAVAGFAPDSADFSRPVVDLHHIILNFMIVVALLPPQFGPYNLNGG